MSKKRTWNLPPRRTSGTDELPYRRRDVLLSRGEAAFFRALLRAASARYVVAFKVRAADLITCGKSAWNDGFGHMVAKHHVDFVLCDRRTTKIIAAIELDDRSHDTAKRQKRDKFLNSAFAAAGLPLVRFRAAAFYDPCVIADLIQSSLRR